MTRRVGRGHATALFFAGLLGLSFIFPPHFVFARYPATFYLLAAPLNVAADVLQWRSPVLANHITNALSVPVWLFLLRPIFVRRWPDLIDFLGYDPKSRAASPVDRLPEIRRRLGLTQADGRFSAPWDPRRECPSQPHRQRCGGWHPPDQIAWSQS